MDAIFPQTPRLCQCDFFLFSQMPLYLEEAIRGKNQTSQNHRTVLICINGQTVEGVSQLAYMGNVATNGGIELN